MPNVAAQETDFIPPKGLVVAAGGLFALLAVSGLGGLLASVALASKPAWTLFGFEAVVTVSAIVGLLYTRSGCRSGSALGLAAVGGTIGAASLLGYLGVQGSLGTLSLMPFVGVRCLAAGGVLGLALIAAMRGNRRSWTTLFKGVVAGIPAAAAVAVFVVPGGKRVLDAVSGLGGFATFIIGTFAFLLATASASAAVHLIVRSFHIAAEDDGNARTPT